MAERPHLGLVRQIGDHGLVRLQAPQDVRTHERTQRSVRVVGLRRHAFRERRERFSRSQQTRIEKVEDGPEIAKTILHRRAGQRDARSRVDLLGRLRLLGAGRLDGLRFVQDRDAPRRVEQRGHPEQRSVAGDDEVDTRDPVAIECLQFGASHCRGMRDRRPEARGEPFDLRSPVGQQGCRCDEQTGAPRLVAWRARFHHQQQCQHLHRLAEPHIVGEAGAQAEARQQVQPAHAGLLIRAERCLQGRARIEVRQFVRIAKTGERLRQPRPGDHL